MTHPPSGYPTPAGGYGHQPAQPGTGPAWTPAPAPAAPAAPAWTPPGVTVRPASSFPPGLGGAAAEPEPVEEPIPLVAADLLPAGRPKLERLLYGLVANDGSDMHLDFGQLPRYRVRGSLLPVSGEPVCTDEILEDLLREALTPEAWAEFAEHGDLDAAYAMVEEEGSALTARFRVNVYRSMGHIGVVARLIPSKIATLDQLGVLPQVKSLAGKPRGLILVCGPTGSGKSTTMAALIDLINETRDERIFTFEDPVEFTHKSKKCLVTHREIGTDTPSFGEGLRRVRRQDPDIILIGEMRDYETIDAAIEAADTGHLVLGTLHTNSAAETISRIINSFPAERQNQVRTTLSSVLIAVICQTLVPSDTAERGRVVATEIMMVTPGIRNNIRENDIPAIVNALTDTSDGSISLDAHLARLINAGQITQKEALKKASSPAGLMRVLDGGNHRSGA